MPVLWAFGPGLWTQKCYSAILYLSIFVGFLNLVATDEFAEKVEKIRCAGQALDEDVCASNLCYDSIHIIHDIVDTGCAATSLCTAPGCFLDEDRQEFICCCRHAYCNGKSHRMVKARWRMFQNGDYHQNIVSRSPRLIPRNVKTPEGDTPLTTSQIQTKPDARPSSITTRISAIIQTTTPTEPPTIKHSTKASTIAATKLEENRKAKPKPTQAPNRASPVSKKTQQTAMQKSVSSAASTTPPSVQINYVSPNTTTDLPEYTTTIEVMTSKKSTTQKQLPNSKKIVQTERLNPITTTSFLNTTQSAKSTTEGSPMTTKMAETTATTPTKQSSTTLLPKTTTTVKSDPHENKQQANTLAQANYVETTQKSPTLKLAQSTLMPKGSSSKSSTEVLPDKRTTRSPFSDQNDFVLPHTYPWYWVCLFGFAVSAVIFLVVFFCLRRCGYGRVRRRSSGELANSRQADEEFAISPREEPKKIINGKRKVKRSENKILLKTKNIPNGITNESLASRCTAITTASGKTHGDDDDFTIGKELTVIDPLLNKSYSGTVHDPPGGNKTTKY
ncbi:hypothetical protein DdX_02188 [Ditylenchus destructor]|uniref:Uncharacterized protein n=1 Tax=Ditylenchus destructor TaxID=166010 RepID=A0AAD4NC21_9BILA|nr:hypothetical protein DdX_02188 [Ditylenchus destructor]